MSVCQRLFGLAGSSCGGDRLSEGQKELKQLNTTESKHAWPLRPSPPTRSHETLSRHKTPGFAHVLFRLRKKNLLINNGRINFMKKFLCSRFFLLTWNCKTDLNWFTWVMYRIGTQEQINNRICIFCPENKVLTSLQVEFLIKISTYPFAKTFLMS